MKKKLSTMRPGTIKDYDDVICMIINLTMLNLTMENMTSELEDQSIC